MSRLHLRGLSRRACAVRGLLLVVALTGVLAACGKKGLPEPPGPPDRITHPKIYPTR